MKNLLSVCVLVQLLSVSVFAQPDTLWSRLYGTTQFDESGNSVKQTTDGGFIIAGTSDSPTSVPSLQVFKTDALGNIEFMNSYSDVSTGSGPSVDLTDDGYIIACTRYIDNTSVWLLKIDFNCDTIWTKTYGGSDFDNGVYVSKTQDGGFIIVGNTNSFGAGGYDVYLIKTDNEGNELWSRTFGGALNDYGYCVKQTNDGGYIITGVADLDFTNGESDIYLLRTDALGNEVWSQTYDESDNDYGTCVIVTDDNGFMVTGIIYNHPPNSFDCILLKTDSVGNIIWSQTYGGEEDDRSYSLQQTSDGGYIFTGAAEIDTTAYIYELLVTRTDSIGNVIWTTSMGGYVHATGYCVQITEDDGFIVIGEYEPYVTADKDLWLIRFDSENNVIGDNYLTTNLYSFELLSPSPNPFNQHTVLDFVLPAAGKISLIVYDITGREVTKLVDGMKPAGSHQVVFDAKDLSSGVYFARLETGEFRQTIKVLVVK